VRGWEELQDGRRALAVAGGGYRGLLSARDFLYGRVS
jgi:hypothetical protein